MTNLVSQYIKKGLHSLYYAFYVIIEGIFKVSHSWNPIISIAGIISLLVALPLINIIRLLFPDFDYASPILDFSIFRGQNRHFCPRLVSFEHQTKA